MFGRTILGNPEVVQRAARVLGPMSRPSHFQLAASDFHPLFCVWVGLRCLRVGLGLVALKLAGLGCSDIVLGLFGLV